MSRLILIWYRRVRHAVVNNTTHKSASRHRRFIAILGSVQATCVKHTGENSGCEAGDERRAVIICRSDCGQRRGRWMDRSTDRDCKSLLHPASHRG